MPQRKMSPIQTSVSMAPLVVKFSPKPPWGMSIAISEGFEGLPRDLAVMQTYDKIQAAFPGGPVPAVTVVKADDVTSPDVQAAIKDLQRDAIANVGGTWVLPTELSDSQLPPSGV